MHSPIALRTPEAGGSRRSSIRSLALAAVGAVSLLLPGTAAASVTPLPASDYAVRPACPAPQAGRASCLALTLVPLTAQARAHDHPLAMTVRRPLAAPSPAEGAFGLRPADLHSGYDLPAGSAKAQTIAIVDAYNDPTAASDLAEYSSEFSLAQCTVSSGCFRQVNQAGESSAPPFPKSSAELEAALGSGKRAQVELAEVALGWGLEISLDIDTTHSVCQNCSIILVEANNESDEALEAAEATAERLGATEISNSWGGSEEGESALAESRSPFNHPGTVITASAGDDGYLSWDSEGGPEATPEFPASAPQVVAVGGTRLTLSAQGAWQEEQVWNGDGAGGGGCSTVFEAPAWQQSLPNWAAVGCGAKRSVADIAAVADPYTGLAVHDSSTACETAYEQENVKKVAYWCTIGGTSLASPLIAGVFALAGGAGSGEYAGRSLYANAAAKPAALHDVTVGSNGECAAGFDESTGLSNCSPGTEASASCTSKAICLAGVGYDGPSGVGTPDGIAAFAAAGGEGSGQKEPPKEETPAGSASPETPVTPPKSVATGEGEATPVTQPETEEEEPIVISGVTLLPRALSAMLGGHSRIVNIGFELTASGAGDVEVTLQRRVQRHGHPSWQRLALHSTIAVPSGRSRSHLKGRGQLARGTYRLVLTPLGGAPRDAEFRVG